MKEITIDKLNGTVAYNDKYHIYWDTEDLMTYISATTLIGMFEQEFDTEFWLKYKALARLCNPDSDFMSNLRSSRIFDYDVIKQYFPYLKSHKQEFNDTVEQIRKEWKENNSNACTMGTSIHEGYENDFFKDGYYQLSDYGFNHRSAFYYKKGLYEIVKDKQVLPECLVSMKTKSGVRVAGQIDLMVIDNPYINIFDYKGLDINTPILTDNGFKKMSEIKQGDIVFDKDGNKQTVLHKSETHYRKCYKLKFDNGQTVICDDEHRWLKSDGIVITAREIAMMYFAYPFNAIHINLQSKIKTGNIKYKIHPFIYGLWIAYKNKTGDFRSNMTSRELREVNEFLAKNYIGVVTNFKQLGDIIKRYDDDAIKCNYINTSVKSRCELLRGIISFYGHIVNEYGEVTVMIPNKIAPVFKSTISSLGVKLFKEKCSNNKSVYSFKYNNVIKGNIGIKDNVLMQEDNALKIVSIEEVKSIPTQCIEVSGDTHTYLCTYSLVPTHNTNKKLKFESYKDKNGHVMMKEPLNHLMDCNMIHYTLQLSLYQYIVWRLNQNLKPSIPKIIYTRDKNNIKFHQVGYLRKEVVDMLKYFRDYILGSRYNYSKVIFKDGKYFIE